MTGIESLRRDFHTYLQHQFSTPIAQSAYTFEVNADESKQQFGDISSNIALVMAKQLQKKPRDIAHTIAQSFKGRGVQSLEIAGPGFLNFFLAESFFQEIAHTLLEEGQGAFKSVPNQKYHVNIEYVSANPTGPLHLGHGRGGIIGDVLGNILSFLGHTVTKEFYVNDAGSQMHKLGMSLRIRVEQELGTASTLPEQAYHGQYLVDLAQQLLAHHGKNVVQESDEFFTTYAYKHLLAAIKATLSAYGLEYNVWFSEQTLHKSDAVNNALNDLTNNGYTYTKDSALWFKATEFGDDKDRVLVRDSGEPTYVAADGAYLQNKVNRKADKLIMILGQDHHSYPTRLAGLVQALALPAELTCIIYQMVSITNAGKLMKMSKRAGTMVTLQEIIDAVGTDVARFFYLNRKADAHLDFNIDLALEQSDANPVYYIQYAYVRTGSILEKAQEHAGLQNVSHKDIGRCSRDDRVLLKKIITLKSLLEAISHNYQTHLLAYFAIELAQAFHRYYGSNRVVDPEDIATSRHRIALLKTVRSALSLNLTLLGLSKPERL